MTAAGISEQVFERTAVLPDEQLRLQGERLIGFLARRERLRTHLRLLSDKAALEDWSVKYHGMKLPLLETLGDRYPLVIFHGDVGTGKTATAEALADDLARLLPEHDSKLFKLSTRVRGEGRVGEMSTLLGEAFNTVTRSAGKKGRAALIIDEADSLAASRGQDQSHHEDKVAVNTLIQRIDDLRAFHGRVVVFLCTNRLTAIDPAIRRRAAITEEFRRPAAEERLELFRQDLDGLNLTENDLKLLVAVTGSVGDQPAWTYSDLRTRLYPEAAARAFPARMLRLQDLLDVAHELLPTPEALW